MNALLETRNIAVEHGKLRAIWDVSFSVRRGERVGLLGSNGVGKSTTLGAVMGLYPPASGEILFEGQPIQGRAAADIVGRGIVLVPEGRRLFAEMTVRENLEMGAYLPGPRKHIAATINQVFALFPILAAKAGQQAGQLSGGQQQMVAIGRAMMSRPQLLLLDEPFLGVAPLLVEEVLTALARVAETGVTVLLVEQNIHRALDFVDRAYVIENGRTVLEGSRDALLGDPDFSKKFLGLD
jgi:branched-chain amino acid transport system ATP-binding protein